MTCPSRCPNLTTVPNQNQAVVLNGIKNLSIEDRPVPTMGDHQVLLQMEVVGICGSDVHYYREGSIGPFVLKGPMIIGHEGSGTVVQCGKDVKNLQVGDKVAIEPQICCKLCDYCKKGRYNLCPNLFFCATPPDDGNLCRYYAHDADFCFKLPENMDLEHGALMEPLAVGVHACKRAHVHIGDSVLVLGAGPIGLVTVMTAKAFGASKVLAVDIEDIKTKKALEIGADYVINVKDMLEEDIVKSIHDTLGHHPHKTIDCGGFEQSVRVALLATRTGGCIIMVGLAVEEVKIPLTQLVTRQLDLLSVFRYVNDYPTAIELVRSGKIDPKPLITHHFKFEESVKAFDLALEQKEPFIKILIHANPQWKAS